MRETNITICSYDVLPNGHVKPSALQRYFQQIALEDISAVGATYQAMRSHSMVFVITKLRMDFFGDILSGDGLVLRTYPYKVEGVTFFRAFELYKNGELVCNADSRWVLINYVKRTIVRPTELPFEIPEAQPTSEFFPIPRRVSQTTVEKSVERSVLLTEVDENHHLNNCYYSDYLLDHAPVNVLAHPIAAVCILFDHEAYLGDVLELRFQTIGEGFSAVAVNKTAAKNCFQAIFALDFSRKI